MESIVVVIINYKKSGDTLRALESLEPLAESGIIKVVVIDSASSEQSRTALGSFKAFPIEVRCFDLNTGFAGGVNAGVAAAAELRADAVWLLNSDARVLPNTLLEMLRCMMEEEVPIVGSTIFYDDGSNNVWFAKGRVYQPSFVVKHVGKRMRGSTELLAGKTEETDFVTGCSMLIRMDVFEGVGLFDDELFLYCEDVDFCLRARQEGYDMVIASGAIVYHKVSSASGGEFNPTREYYITRNSYALIARYVKNPVTRVIVYSTRSLWDIYRIAKSLRKGGENPMRAFGIFFDAIGDFFAGRMGERKQLQPPVTESSGGE
ncbi:MAG: glycosyltransferase family 2 protein [Bdellovibrionales bacterium]|nr:glycosyltransferase family 2 protein [Bdellovibrionales bacterium]